MPQSIRAPAVCAVVFTASLASAFAGVVVSKKGLFDGFVRVIGGPANQSGEVQQSPDGENYANLAYDVETDGAGNGEVRVTNLPSTHLNCNQFVRVVFPGSPPMICGPGRVRNVRSWFPAFLPGSVMPIVITVDQDVTDDEGTLLETWDDGADWTLRLNGSEATWVNSGSPSITSAEGDLSVTLTSVTSADVAFHIIHDSTPLTPNSIIITGLQVSVPNSTTMTLHTQYGLLGSASTYMDGEFLGTNSFASPTFVEASDISLAAPAIPALSKAWLVALVIVLTAAGFLAIRRHSVGA